MPKRVPTILSKLPIEKTCGGAKSQVCSQGKQVGAYMDINSHKKRFIGAKIGRDSGIVASADASAALLKDISEKKFTQAVIEIAERYNWLVHHAWTSMRMVKRTNKIAGETEYIQIGDASSKGFPDLVMVHKEKGQVLFAELKIGNKKLEVGQEEWADALIDVGIFAERMVAPGRNFSAVRYYLWRPRDMPQIEEVLK